MLMALMVAVRLAGVAALAPVAFHFPAVDIPKMCAGAAVFGTSDKTYRICLRDEGAARDRLRALWPSLTAKDREICLGDAELAVARSYVDMVGCVAMNQELSREEKLPPSHGLPPQ